MSGRQLTIFPLKARTISQPTTLSSENTEHNKHTKNTILMDLLWGCRIYHRLKHVLMNVYSFILPCSMCSIIRLTLWWRASCSKYIFVHLWLQMTRCESTLEQSALPWLKKITQNKTVTHTYKHGAHQAGKTCWDISLNWSGWKSSLVRSFQ